MKEKWKEIIGFEGLYEISNMGRVRNPRTGRILKLNANTVGYLQAPLTKNGKCIPKCVHKLVAEAFIKNPMHYKEVNHLDENKQNNAVNNLKWCTHRENIMYGTCIDRAKKKRKETCPPKKVLAIFQDNSTHCYNSASEASNQLGISVNGIYSVLSGNRFKYQGIRWMYLDK